MKIRSITLPGVLIRAALAGRVTELRVPVRPQPDEDGIDRIVRPVPEPFWRDTSGRKYRCPLGVAGDRLWVQEWHAWSGDDPSNGALFYREDVTRTLQDRLYANIGRGLSANEIGRRTESALMAAFPGDGRRWRPPSEMEQGASRLAFDVLGSRVERLNDISDESCAASGVTEEMVEKAAKSYGADAVANGACWQLAFADMWNDAHGCNDYRHEKRGDCPLCWNNNSHVWVATVRRA